MGDIGDYWRDLKDYIDRGKYYASERRDRRVTKFQHNLEQIADLARLYGIEIKSPDEWHHIQIRHGDYIGNYYPSTRKFFFQRPVLTPTQRDIAPEDVLLIFLKHALQIESLPEEFYNAWWSFDSRGAPPKEVVRIGQYIMPVVRREILRLGSYRPELIRDVDPTEFEHLIAELLRCEGFSVSVTQATRDRGRDLIAMKDENGRTFVLLVECKHWLDRSVGISVVQRLVGVRYIDRADHAMVVTTAQFSEPAIEEAEKVVSELTLVDAERLQDWLRNFEARMNDNGRLR